LVQLFTKQAKPLSINLKLKQRGQLSNSDKIIFYINPMFQAEKTKAKIIEEILFADVLMINLLYLIVTSYEIFLIQGAS